jgi:hypothetical protein
VRWWLIPLLALLLDLAVVFFVQPREAVRDETVFYPAAQAFARASALPSLEFLRHYPAPQTPLSLYLAGRLLAVASSLQLLRVLNSLLMSAALLRFSWFARRHFEGYATLSTALLASNPYFHLAATHFYTDALYFLLVVLVVTRAAWRQAWLPLTLLPLTRQYGVIFALGEAALAVIERRFRAAAVALLSLLREPNSVKERSALMPKGFRHAATLASGDRILQGHVKQSVCCARAPNDAR